MKRYGTGVTTLKMYRGNITDSVKLDTITLVDEFNASSTVNEGAKDNIIWRSSADDVARVEGGGPNWTIGIVTAMSEVITITAQNTEERVT